MPQGLHDVIVRNGAHEFNLDAMIESDMDRKRRRQGEHKVITLREYITLVKNDPLIPQNSPSRLLELVNAHGIEEIPESERWLGVQKRYRLYTDELFGADQSISKIVEHLISGAANASSGKYVLVIVGPTSSGKSTFSTITKNALESYRTRPVFAIRGCPIHEEPLHALPRHLTMRGWKSDDANPPIEETLGIPPIEGDLCPPCRDMLKKLTDADGVVRWWDLEVETFSFSIQGVVGIGSFEPANDVAQDITELVGRENIGVTSDPKRGYDDPYAFTLDGEIEKGNRGVVEGIELLKGADKILRVFISLAEEKKIKVQGSSFPHIFIDTWVIGHCNLKEFKEFSANQRNAALHDRMYVAAFPYTLRVKEEMRIYKKLIEQESEFLKLKEVHIPDASYELAATFAILTRLNESPKYSIDRLAKLDAYNGKSILSEIKDKDKRPIDLRSLIEEWNNPDVDIEKREGMFGVSPRDVLAALNTALARQGQKGCLTPLTTLKALSEVFDHRMGYTGEEIKKFRELLTSGEGRNVMARYKEYVIQTMTKSFLRAYDSQKRGMVAKYKAEARLYREQHRKYVRRQMIDIDRDPITQKPREPDDKFMKSMEKYMEIAESAADVFRGEIVEYLESSPMHIYEPLEKAAEKKLIDDNRTTLVFLFDDNRPLTEDEIRQRQDVVSTLNDMGFCQQCMSEVIKRYYEFMKT